MKKFCKNCKYGKGKIFCSYIPKYEYTNLGSEFCGSHKKRIINEANRIYPAYKYELNKDGDCKHYKERWWKFWVKTNKQK